MSERYTKLFALPANLYAEGAPVIVAAGNLLKDNQTGKVLAQLKIKNISPKTIKATKVIIHALDTAGKTLDGDTEQEYLDLVVNQGNEFGQKQAIPLSNSSTRGFDVDVTQIVFSDNSIWEGTHAAWAPLPAAESLSQRLGDTELVKQYRIKFGGVCEVTPRVERDLWLCTCGTWNRESSCYRCGKTKSMLLPIELESLIKDRDERLAQEQLEREAKEAADKAAAEARAKKLKTVRTIALFAVVFCLAAALVIKKVVIPNNEYKSAMSLYEAGQYADALETFVALGDYKDCKAKVKKIEVWGEVIYKWGDRNYYSKEYKTAMEWYLKAAGVGNADAMFMIGYLYDEGFGVEQDYEKAMEWYLKAAEKGDSSAMNNIGVLYGKGLGVEKDYSKAMEWYLKAAEKGDKFAMKNIGYYYKDGQGVKQDYSKAMEWFKKAVENGNESAQEEYDKLYEQGYRIS